VSEVKDWKLLDLVQYTATLDKEMEQGRRQMIERLLAREEEAEACQEEVVARQEESTAQAAASLKELKEDIKGHMKALLEGLRSCRKRVTACQVWSVACP
jgi:anti-sigma factor RsiW